ncbi:hypothetical protein E3J95_03825 [Candidatus Aerophobetes bacterium]|uniref:Uncharacterized protein n=1 Tax=Aerophobetes bacterium TaxID=2030807 RepID=A0A523QJ67_UNCAE|nr:MAG: hypothetical protein E3J95_03825 [Candidatus Aerophobetes bacterium]
MTQKNDIEKAEKKAGPEKRALSTSTLFTWVSLIVVLAVLVMTIIATLQISPGKYKSIKTEFFQQLDAQIALDSLVSVEDVEMIQIGVSREKDSEKLRSDDLQGLLTEYLVYAGAEKDSDQSERAKKVNVIKALLREVTSEKPFTILPDEDQLTAIELKNSIELGDEDTALSRLHLLSTSVGKEISSLKRRVESGWRWTIYSALIGGLGVIVTIVLSLLYRGAKWGRELDYLMREVRHLRHNMYEVRYRVESEQEGQSTSGKKP